METIHFKTVDPLSQDLLRGASRKGLGLNWDRYEKQQPQDGFLRLGLSCPYGCMQGPCRIDPYGRGADRGICGLDRDGMTAAFLLRLSLMGAQETLARQTAPQGDEISWPASLQGKANAALAQTGGDPLSLREISDSALLLSRPSAAPEALVRQAVRLGLLSVALASSRKARAMKVRAGYGLLAGEAVSIGIAGQVPASLIRRILKEAAGIKKPEVRLVSLGDWIPAGDAYLPIVCTSGEAEAVLSSGKLNLLLAGPQTDPALSALCATMGIPVLGESAGAAEIVKGARAAYDRRTRSTFDPDAALIGEAAAISSPKNGSAKITLLGGSDSLLQSLGYLPVELAKALIGQDHAVASWGDAAVWMLKQNLPVGILGAGEGPLAAVKALASSGKLGNLKGILFTGFKHCSEFAQALGLAALGMKVSVAVPLPLWGSEKVKGLVQDHLASTGGLLAHLDHPAKAEEILEWFLADGGARKDEV